MEIIEWESGEGTVLLVMENTTLYAAGSAYDILKLPGCIACQGGLGNDNVKGIETEETSSDAAVAGHLCSTDGGEGAFNKVREILVTEIAPYCFSESSGNREALTKARELLKEHINNSPALKGFTVFKGSFVKEAHLPLSLEKIGEYGFYNCKNLEKISFGPGLSGIHSDVFMNCIKLKQAVLYGSPTEPTGLYNVLSRIANDIEIIFSKESVSKLFYPEYSINHEAVYAAHIFQVRVDGGGYALRQAFTDNIVNLDEYDKRALKYIPGEEMERAVAICSMRLVYPIGLKEEYKSFYEGYIRDNQIQAALILCKNRWGAELKSLSKMGIIGPDGLKSAINYARDKGDNAFIMELCRI